MGDTWQGCCLGITPHALPSTVLPPSPPPPGSGLSPGAAAGKPASPSPDPPAHLGPVVAEDAHHADGDGLVQTAPQSFAVEREHEGNVLLTSVIDDGVQRVVQPTWSGTRRRQGDARGFSLHSDTLSGSCRTPAGQAATASAPFLSATWEKPTLLRPLPNGVRSYLSFRRVPTPNPNGGGEMGTQNTKSLGHRRCATAPSPRQAPKSQCPRAAHCRLRHTLLSLAKDSQNSTQNPSRACPAYSDCDLRLPSRARAETHGAVWARPGASPPPAGAARPARISSWAPSRRL